MTFIRHFFRAAFISALGSPLLGLSLSADQPAPSADAVSKFHGAAHFVVRPEVVAENPGPYTFTTDQGNVNAWLQSGNFEPFSRRTKFHAIGDSPNEILLRNGTISKSDSFQSGWFDGATVRVYRIVDGQLKKVRVDTVKEHIIEGWNTDGGSTVSRQLLTGASAQTYVQPWSRHGCKYYYSVIAISKSGNQSPRSNYATVSLPAEFAEKRGAASNERIKFRRPRPATAEESLQAPTDFIARLDEATGMITCSWTPSGNPEVAIGVGNRRNGPLSEPSVASSFRLWGGVNKTPSHGIF